MKITGDGHVDSLIHKWIEGATVEQLNEKKSEYLSSQRMGGRDAENATRLVRQLDAEIQRRCGTS